MNGIIGIVLLTLFAVSQMTSVASERGRRPKPTDTEPTTLEEIFVSYSRSRPGSKGRKGNEKCRQLMRGTKDRKGRKPGMDLEEFSKLFKDHKLYNKQFTADNTNEIFNRAEVERIVRPKKIDFSNFEVALELAAEQKYGSKDDVDQLEKLITAESSLQEIFDFYSRYDWSEMEKTPQMEACMRRRFRGGAKARIPGMDAKEFRYIFRDFNLYDAQLTSDDIDSIFNSNEVEGIERPKQIDFSNFEVALGLAAEQIYGGANEVDQLEERIVSGHLSHQPRSMEKCDPFLEKCDTKN